jgi:hypothetical protein
MTDEQIYKEGRGQMDREPFLIKLQKWIESEPEKKLMFGKTCSTN